MLIDRLSKPLEMDYEFENYMNILISDRMAYCPKNNIECAIYSGDVEYIKLNAPYLKVNRKLLTMSLISIHNEVLDYISDLYINDYTFNVYDIIIDSISFGSIESIIFIMLKYSNLNNYIVVINSYGTGMRYNYKKRIIQQYYNFVEKYRNGVLKVGIII